MKLENPVLIIGGTHFECASLKIASLMEHQPPIEPLVCGETGESWIGAKNRNWSIDVKLHQTVKQQYAFRLFIIDPNNRLPRGFRK